MKITIKMKNSEDNNIFFGKQNIVFMVLINDYIENRSLFREETIKNY